MGTGGDTEAEGDPVFVFHRDLIDDVTPNTPVLLSRFDAQQFLANARALGEGTLTCEQAGVDREEDQMTGRLTPGDARGSHHSLGRQRGDSGAEIPNAEVLYTSVDCRIVFPVDE